MSAARKGTGLFVYLAITATWVNLDAAITPDHAEFWIHHIWTGVLGWLLAQSP